MIVENLQVIRQQLPVSVRLIAVTKQVTIDLIREAYALGIRDFGENRVQEAEAKQEQLQDLPDITWHLIGHLQSNKARRAVEKFSWIHSLDSLALAQRLNQLAIELDLYPKVCLQVKLLPDPTKTGWAVDELMSALPDLNELKALDIQGLMVIPPLNLDPAKVLAVFQQARDLATHINQQNWPHLNLTELSMGMSGDYPLAVQAGSTMVRLGRVLFGDRPSPAKS